MMRCRNLLAGMIVIPNVPFQYQLTGYDTKGNQFSKTKHAVLNSHIKAKTCNSPLPTPSTAFSTPVVSVAVSATPSPSTISSSGASFYCPCHNGGMCITIKRFGRTRVLCSCPKGYSGSLCQSSKSKLHRISFILLICLFLFVRAPSQEKKHYSTELIVAIRN